MSILCVFFGHKWKTKFHKFEKVAKDHAHESLITWDQCLVCNDTRALAANPDDRQSRFSKPQARRHEYYTEVEESENAADSAKNQYVPWLARWARTIKFARHAPYDPELPETTQR